MRYAFRVLLRQCRFRGADVHYSAAITPLPRLLPVSLYDY